MNKKTNLEHYKDELKEIVRFRYDRPLKLADEIRTKLDKDIMYGPGSGNECFTDSILDWMAQPYEEPILDKVEKEYLSNFIKPFRNRVKSIHLSNCNGRNRIYAVVREYDSSYYEVIALPCFKEGTMYKGMEYYKKYSLKELGL